MIEFFQTLAAMFPTQTSADVAFIIATLLVFITYGTGMALIAKYVVGNETDSAPRGATPLERGE